MNSKEDSSLIIKKLQGIISILIAILIILLYIKVNFNLYNKYYTQEGLLGYYTNENEFYTILNEQTKEQNEDEHLIFYNLNQQIYHKKVLLKDKYKTQINNIELIQKQLEKKYIIYKITIDDEKEIYFNSQEEMNQFLEANTIKWSKTTIMTTDMVVDNLDLLSSQDEIDDIVSRVNRQYYVASRGGISTSRYGSRIAVENIRFIAPVNSTTITSYFGARTLNGSSSFHTGLDLAAPMRSTVFASAAGTVIFAGWNGSYGNYIKIDHGDGVVTCYAHNDEILCAVGDRVEQGDPIAFSGTTGRSTGPHVHFEIMINSEFQNPLNYITF